MQEVEFSLFENLQLILINRKKIAFYIGGGLVIGLLFAFLFNPEEYKSRAVILPVSNSFEPGASGLLKQFGKLGGISLGGPSSNEGIPPGLYPNVVNSTPFLLYISSQSVAVEETDSNMQVFDYFNTYHRSGFGGFLRSWTIELPDKIMGLLREKKEADTSFTEVENMPIQLTKKQLTVINILNDRITVKLDEEIGIVELHVMMPEPKMAAQVATLTLNYLMEYSIAFKTDKERANQEFIQGRYEDAKERFYEAQEKLALFNDRNQNLTLARAQAEKERLEAEYNLTFNLYNGLSQQLEETRIKVQEKTPAFKVLEPVQIPLKKSSPRKLLIILLFGLGGLVVGITAALYGPYFRDFYDRLRKGGL